MPFYDEFPTWLRSFLEYLELEREASAHTIAAYEGDLVDMYRILRSEGLELRGSHEDLAVLRRYLQVLATEGVDGHAIHASSIGRKLAAVRSFSKFLTRRGVLQFNAARLLKTPKAEKRLPGVVSERTMARVLGKSTQLEANSPVDQAIQARDLAVLELLYSSGLRRFELCSIQLEDLDVAAGTLRVLGKGNKQRVVPVGGRALEAIAMYRAHRPELLRRFHGDATEVSDTLFLGRNGNKLNPRMVYTITERAFASSSDVGKAHPHMLRHTCATHLLDRGADIRAVKDVLGHESLRTTQRYTHLTVDRMRSAYDKAHPRSGSE